MSSATDRPPSDWAENLGRNRALIGYALFGVAALFAVLTLVLVLRYRTEYPWELLLSAVTVLAALGAGLWQLTREPGELSEADTNRLFILGVGGYAGLMVTLFGLGLIWRWSDTLLGGTEKWQGEQGWQVWLSLAVFFLGLGVMFLSLLVARGQERANPTLRRLMYGYNALLSCLLLAAVLMLVNILGYLYLPVVSDWTAAGLYTLSDKSVTVLRGLEKPVRIHVIQTGRDPRVDSDVRSLLDNMQAQSNKVEVEYVSYHRQPERRSELEDRYQLVENVGILVVYGTEADALHQFIKEPDLTEQRMTRGRQSEAPTFKGEDAVISAIDFLSQGKSKPVVYFTQGNGELELGEMDANRPDRGLGLLRERLVRANYEVKGLQLVPVAVGLKPDPQLVRADKVPDDATAVVLAGPRERLPAETLSALTEYMNRLDPKTKARAGKLVVLLDVNVGRDGVVAETGLEKWLGEYNVEVGTNRLVTAHVRPHTSVLVTPNPRLRGNPIAQHFAGRGFRLYDARTVGPRTPAAPGAPPAKFRTEELLVTVPGREPITWPETNLRADPGQLVEDMVKNRREDLATKIEGGPFSTAVVVTEPSALPDIPEHRGMPMAGDGKPRLVVIGDATLASNRYMAEGFTYYDLLASALSWLRERPQNIGIEAKKRDTYTMEQTTNVTRLAFAPVLLMAFGVLYLGVGVWVVRRR